MNDGSRRKSGAIRLEDYERAEYLKGLSEVSKKLQEQYGAAKFDTKAVGNFVALIKQFMEDALGIKALPPRISPKIPAKLFQDMRPDGALFHILRKFHELMTSKSLKRMDFTNPYHRKQLVEILLPVVKDMESKGFLQWPKVFIHPSCGAETESLKEMITGMRGTIAPSAVDSYSPAESPGVTHHIQPFGPKGDPDDGVQYMRNLGKRDTKALVHWWYYPDSYDELVDPDDAPEVIEVDKQAEGPWKVYTRWVKDSVKYNEWMNPIDYELEDQPQPKGSSAGTAQEQAATSGAPVTGAQQKGVGTASLALPVTSLPALGQMAPKLAPIAGSQPPVQLPEVAPGQGAEVSPGLVKHKLLRPDPKFLTPGTPAINLVQQQDTAKPKKANAKGDNNANRKPAKLPACSAWFSLNDVSEIEMQAFAKQLKGEGTDGEQETAAKEEYMTIRNAMIAKHRTNPSRHLSFLEASKALPGDIALLVEVWAFLDGWDIINFNTTESAEADPTSAAPDNPGPASDRETAAAALRDAQAIYQSRQTPKPQQGVAAVGGKVKSAGLVGRKPKRRKTVSPPEPYIREARFFCNAMPGVECTKLRYHCTKLPDLDLCPQAYAEGRFPAGCTTKDFIRIDQTAAEGVDESVWSDMDTLLLLEGLELFGDNWAEISDHVGTKSQVQCITHFLKLPIEDEFLDRMEDPDRGGAAAVATGEDKVDGLTSKSSLAPIPFADQGNPVTAQVAFLAAIVGPEVAAVAAQEALDVLLGDNNPLDDQLRGPLDTQPEGVPSAPCVRRAAIAGLSAAAVKARQLADGEEKEIQRLLSEALAAQAELIELRLKVFTQMKQAMRAELTSLQAQREALAADRVKLQDVRSQPQVSAPFSATPWQPVVPTSHAQQAVPMPSATPISLQGAAPKPA